MDKPGKGRRIWELDFLKGIALLLMVYFHLIYDLDQFFNNTVSIESPFNAYTGKAAGLLFIFTAGIGTYLSRNNLKRGLKLFGIAIIITIASYIYSPDEIIMFGILHFFAACILLYPLFRKLNPAALFVLGVLIYLLKTPAGKINMPFNYLFPLGLINQSFASSDYYPLIPYLGIFIFGVAIGKILYKEKTSIFKFQPPKNFINFAGRHTLAIYLLHQPIILIVLELIKRIYSR